LLCSRKRTDDDRLDAEVLRLLVDEVPDSDMGASMDMSDHSPRTREALRHMYVAGLPPHRNTCVLFCQVLPVSLSCSGIRAT